MMNHPSDLVIDELASGLATDTASAAHVRDCDHCRARLASLETQRRRSESAPDYHRVLRSLRPPAPPPAPWWRRSWLFLPLAGALAAVALIARPPESQDRLKGNASLAVVRDPSGEEVRGRVRPGEQIALAVGSAGVSNVIVMAVGEDGSVSQVWPLDRNESGPAPHGAAGRLSPPFLVTPGSALLMAFFSERVLSTPAVTDALKDAVARTKGRGQPISQVTPAALPGEVTRVTRLLCVEGSACSSQP